MDLLLRTHQPIRYLFFEKLPLNTLILCYDISPEFASVANAVLKKKSQKDWLHILFTWQLPVSLLEHFQDVLDWDKVVIYQHLSKETIQKFQHRINWSRNSIYSCTPFEILRHFVSNPGFNWSYYCQYVQLPVNYLKENVDKLDWDKVSYYQILDSFFMDANRDKLNWKYVSIRQSLGTDFIIKYANQLHWNELCKHQFISVLLLEKYYRKRINWNSVIRTQRIPDYYIESMKDELDWNHVVLRHPLTEDQCMKYEDRINWRKVAGAIKLSVNFIKKNLHRLDWMDIMINQNLTEEVLEESIDVIDWGFISENNRLPLSFIKNHINDLNISKIVMMRTFPVDFIENVLLKDDRFHNDPEEASTMWDYISLYKTLNQSFIHKHRDKVNWRHICKFRRLTETFIEDHLKYVDWSSICFSQNLSEKFMLKYKNHICWPIVLVKDGISPNFINYVTSNYVDMTTLLTYYNTMRSFKEVHDIYCPKKENCYTSQLPYMNLGDDFEKFNPRSEHRCDFIFVNAFKTNCSNVEGNSKLCTSFKTCRGCTAPNCKRFFCNKLAIFVQLYNKHIFAKFYVGDSVPYLTTEEKELLGII